MVRHYAPPPVLRQGYALGQLMSSAPAKIHVPGNHLMVGLLGERDELLRQIEAAFPATAIHVRGNEISVMGAEADEVARLFGELVHLLEAGHRLELRHPDPVVRSGRDPDGVGEIVGVVLGDRAVGLDNCRPDREFLNTRSGEQAVVHHRRAIDIHEGEELDESAFKALVQQAVALNSSGKSKPAKKS